MKKSATITVMGIGINAKTKTKTDTVTIRYWGLVPQFYLNEQTTPVDHNNAEDG